MKIPEIKTDAASSRKIQQALDVAHFTDSDGDWGLVRKALRNAGYPFSPEHTSEPILEPGYHRNWIEKTNTLPENPDDETPKQREMKLRIMEEVWCMSQFFALAHPIEKALCEKNIAKLVHALVDAGHRIKHPQFTAPEQKPGAEGPNFS